MSGAGFRRDVNRAVLTCPFCPWHDELVFTPPVRLELAAHFGERAIDAHDAAAAHFELRTPARLGYFRGEPIS